MTTRVLVTDDGPVRILTLSGPGRLNAIGQDTADAIHDEVLHAERDNAIRALVLTGADGHFSAGGDAAGVLGAGRAEHPDDDTMTRFMRSYQRAASAVWHSSLPVVAAVSGVAYGGALNLALACDLVVCSRDARLCEVFVKRGVVPDFAGAFTLPRLVGMRRAMELVLLAEEIGAEQARELGMVNHVADTPDEALSHALELAHRVARHSPLAVSLSKRMLHEAAGASLQSALEQEALSQALALGSPTAQSAFSAFASRAGTPR